MKPKRTPEMMTELDAKIRPLYEAGLGCRVVATQLKENPVIVYRRVKRMGILRSAEEAFARHVPSVAAVPFGRVPSAAWLRRAATAETARWFMARGYVACIPMESAKYDLVVESDAGLKRVQIKSTNSKNNARWSVSISHNPYIKGKKLNAMGCRKKTAYDASEIDLFFVVTGDGRKFLIPIEAVTGKTQLNLDDKYSRFEVQ